VPAQRYLRQSHITHSENMYSSIRCLSLLSLILSAVQADINGVSSRDIYEEMEHIFLDNAGTNSNGFFEGINPCSKYLGYASDPTNRGEQTAAQWIRTAFHDTITADVAAGTGYELVPILLFFLTDRLTF
jgi:hypothetical protein